MIQFIFHLFPVRFKDVFSKRKEILGASFDQSVSMIETFAEIFKSMVDAKL